MRIGIQTWGSHGDMRPFLALAEGLQAAGNEVHLVLTCVDSAAYSGIVSKHGVKISVLASPVLDPAQEQELSVTTARIKNPMEQLAAILRLCFAPVEDRMFKAAQDLCNEADVVIGHYFMHPLQIAAEKAGRPYVSTVLSHSAVPSDFTNPLGALSLGRTVHRLLWRLVRSLLNRTLLHYPNRLRRQLGMAPAHDMAAQVWLSEPLTLVAVSPQICQRQADWPASVQVCGFLDTPNLDMEGTIPAALATFLAAGDAPVYMTFGSWMPKDRAGQGANLALMTEAAQRAGCRAIIQSASAQECGFVSDERILYIPAAPHQAIFPHCRAVVHHGGAGTTQSVTLAGIPSIVVAHLNEQEHWGRELNRLGVAGKPSKRGKLTAAALAKQIAKVQASPGMGVRAKAIAAAMKEENGVAEAVKLIMERFGSRDQPAALQAAAGEASGMKSAFPT